MILGSWGKSRSSEFSFGGDRRGTGLQAGKGRQVSSRNRAAKSLLPYVSHQSLDRHVQPIPLRLFVLCRYQSPLSGEDALQSFSIIVNNNSINPSPHLRAQQMITFAIHPVRYQPTTTP